MHKMPHSLSFTIFSQFIIYSIAISRYDTILDFDVFIYHLHQQSYQHHSNMSYSTLLFKTVIFVFISHTLLHAQDLLGKYIWFVIIKTSIIFDIMALGDETKRVHFLQSIVTKVVHVFLQTVTL